MLYNERISDERNAGGKREPLQAGGERISEGVMRVQRTPKHGVLRWSEERKKSRAQRPEERNNSARSEKKQSATLATNVKLWRVFG